MQVGGYWLKHRSFEKMHLVTLALIVVFGGATILLQDELFIKWKPTILDWLFALVFLGSQYIGEKNLVRRMMEANVQLPEPIWNRLNFAWVIFFTAMGFLNLYVVYNFNTDIWVNFKLFGMMGLTLAFVIAQAFYLGRYMEEPTNEENP